MERCLYFSMHAFSNCEQTPYTSTCQDELCSLGVTLPASDARLTTYPLHMQRVKWLLCNWQSGPVLWLPPCHVSPAVPGLELSDPPTPPPPPAPSHMPGEWQGQGLSASRQDDFPLSLCMPEAADVCGHIRTSIESTITALFGPSAAVSLATPSEWHLATMQPRRAAGEDQHASLCPICEPHRAALEKVAATCVKLSCMLGEHPLPCLPPSPCHKLLMSPLWQEGGPWTEQHGRSEQDKRVQLMLVSLSFLQPAHIEGLPATLCSRGVCEASCRWPWSAVGLALRDMGEYPAPQDKVTCMLNAARMLHAALAGVTRCPCPAVVTAQPQDPLPGAASGARGPVSNADAFIPALIYACLHAGPTLSTLASDVHAMTAALSLQRGVVSCVVGCDSPSVWQPPAGEEGYMLTALLSALAWIGGAGRRDFNVQDVTEEEWEAKQAEAVARWRAQG